MSASDTSSSTLIYPWSEPLSDHPPRLPARFADLVMREAWPVLAQASPIW